jgi:V/A-type H+-transporting ATPase subunit A
MSYHVTFWKSELIDFCFLQQDGFDPIDSLCPIERQKYMLLLILDICNRDFDFEDYEKCRDYFKNMINLIKQMNYSEYQSDSFNSYQNQLQKLLEENGK